MTSWARVGVEVRKRRRARVWRILDLVAVEGVGIRDSMVEEGDELPKRPGAVSDLGGAGLPVKKGLD